MLRLILPAFLPTDSQNVFAGWSMTSVFSKQRARAHKKKKNHVAHVVSYAHKENKSGAFIFQFPEVSLCFSYDEEKCDRAIWVCFPDFFSS